MEKQRHWLVIYDIRNEKRLLKVAKIIQNYGFRVQKSVFEVNADKNVIEGMRFFIKHAIDEEKDFVAYFEICEEDWQKKEKFGPQEEMQDDEKNFYIV